MARKASEPSKAEHVSAQQARKSGAVIVKAVSTHNASPKRGRGRPPKRWNGWDDPRALLTPQQLEAARLEAAHLVKLLAQNPRHQLPMSPQATIARKVGVTRAAVLGWRRFPHYRAAIRLEMQAIDDARPTPPGSGGDPDWKCSHPENRTPAEQWERTPPHALRGPYLTYHPNCPRKHWPDRPCNLRSCPGRPPPSITFLPARGARDYS